MVKGGGFMVDGEWWMLKDEGWMLKGGWWMLNGEGWMLYALWWMVDVGVEFMNNKLDLNNISKNCFNHNPLPITDNP
jgi:hypothetical protein